MHGAAIRRIAPNVLIPRSNEATGGSAGRVRSLPANIVVRGSARGCAGATQPIGATVIDVQFINTVKLTIGIDLDMPLKSVPATRRKGQAIALVLIQIAPRTSSGTDKRIPVIVMIAVK